MRNIISFFLILCATTLLAQPTTYTARIVEAETGEALPLVSIYVSDENGTLTNFDGEFSITAEPTDLLRLTCIGRQSLALHASELPEVIKMKMLPSTLSEVTVHAVEGKLLEIARRMEKAFGRKKRKQAQYFYRQTSVISLKQDIVEAFISAKSAVNLRNMEFLTGRHGRLSEAQWAQSSVQEMNMHHVLELAPMTREASFWRSLITPLPAVKHQTISGIEYLQRHYAITIEEMDGEDQQLYRIELRRRDEAMTDDQTSIMTGILYVDRPTLSPLAFDGQVENMSIRFGKGELRSATSVPVDLKFHIDYRYDHQYPEVADLSMHAQWGDFQTRTLLFNVSGQKRLRHKRGTSARENMLTSIDKAGYDSTFWANNEVVKRTAEEAAIAQGTVDLQQARLDSITAAQAAMPPLQRLADRLARFGHAIPQEKVYVHMDNTGYFLGDTIWFAAYTRRTNSDTPSRISRVLYAELWNHDGYLVERKLVEMKDGRGRGFFELPDTLYSGYFELRAYTRWQLNWGQTEHYHIKDSEYWFYNRAMAKDFFRDYEKLYSRVFPVYDRPKQQGEFYHDMTLRPLRRYFKTAPKPAELRLSLFPEGGNLVAGVPCRVAFEAATSEGEAMEGRVVVRVKNEKSKLKVQHSKFDTKHAKLKKNNGKEKLSSDNGLVKLMNERGYEVDFVETESRGRGTFIFTPEEDEEYDVVFQPTPSDSQALDGDKVGSTTETIKAIKAEGVALQLRQDTTTGHWQLKLTAAGQAATQPLGVTVMHEGKLRYFREIHQPAHALVDLAISDAQAGVHQVTVFDSIGRVYADRLFFITSQELSQPTLLLSGLKEHYSPFEAVDLHVTSAHLEPGQVISLSVKDASLQDLTFDSGTIQTEMLLASEVKGFVPQPGYFFETDDAEHRRALDLLMLTQGWRRFSWREMAVKGAWELSHPAEHTQIVTGTVNRYSPTIAGFDPNRDLVLAAHEAFMTRNETPLSETSGFRHSDPMNLGAAHGTAAPGAFQRCRVSPFALGHPGYGWNLNLRDALHDGDGPGAFRGGESPLTLRPQRPEWLNNDYDVLSFRTRDDFRHRRQRHAQEVARRYAEEGTVRHDVRVRAEFVNMLDQQDFLVGETRTAKGRFQIDLPRFEGRCVFFLSASDDGKGGGTGRHHRVEVDPTDERSGSPTFPEYYVRLNFPYPRWVRPYSFYQVHNAALPQGRAQGARRRLLTDGTNLLGEVTVRAAHGGLRRIDYGKPACVLDAYEALNLAMDAGLVDCTFSAGVIASQAAMALVGDMGMHRRCDLDVSVNGRPGLNRGPLEQKRDNLLSFIDKICFYTDYSPRREGDERYDQANQPPVRADLRRLPDGEQRVTYRDRRYILSGFACQADFYHPDYQRTPPTPDTRDYRRTLYWNPDLRLDANGRASVRFYTGSRAAALSVEAEGQTADGALLFNADPQR